MFLAGADDDIEFNDRSLKTIMWALKIITLYLNNLTKKIKIIIETYNTDALKPSHNLLKR